MFQISKDISNDLTINNILYNNKIMIIFNKTINKQYNHNSNKQNS